MTPLGTGGGVLATKKKHIFHQRPRRSLVLGPREVPGRPHRLWNGAKPRRVPRGLQGEHTMDGWQETSLKEAVQGDRGLRVVHPRLGQRRLLHLRGLPQYRRIVRHLRQRRGRLRTGGAAALE